MSDNHVWGERTHMCNVKKHYTCRLRKSTTLVHNRVSHRWPPDACATVQPPLWGMDRTTHTAKRNNTRTAAVPSNGEYQRYTITHQHEE